MYCNQCGQSLPPGSRFCNNCGSSLIVASQIDAARAGGPSVAGMPAAPAAAADERMIFTIRPTLVFVIVWYIIAAVILLAVAALMGVLHSMRPDFITGWVAFIVILASGLAAFVIPVYKHILRRREVYTLTNYKLEMRYGLIAKTVRNIPLRNIQDVTVTASVWQRIMKLGDIVIDSASETGRIHLNDIHNPDRYASMILGELRRRN